MPGDDPNKTADHLPHDPNHTVDQASVSDAAEMTTAHGPPSTNPKTFPTDARNLMGELGLPVSSSTETCDPDASCQTGWSANSGSSTARIPEVPGYLIEREVARGGMGMILAAHDVSLDRDVAIKVMIPGRTRVDAVQRFIIESKITARLPHPAIPPIHHLGTLTDGNPFLVMKLIRGKTLSDELKAADRTAELPRFVQIFEQICQAVGFAHSQGIIHRDLKPANVMVGAFGEVQVMDWGLAKDTRSAERATASENTQLDSVADSSFQTVAGSVMGTPAYMAPEQARGEPVGTAADVFALGGILCDILTGRPPFSGGSVMDTVRMAADGDVAPAFSRLDACCVDAELIALCKRCLAPKAEDRPADGRAVADEVAAYRAGVEERLRKAETERAAAEARAAEEANTRREAEARIVEQRKKRRVQMALAGAVALLLLGGAAFAWWRDHKEEETRINQAMFDTERKLKAEQARERTVNLLRFAEDARKEYRYSAAENALKDAGELAAQFELNIAGDVEQAKADLAFVIDLDAIRMKRSTWIAEEGGKGHFDEASAPGEYRAAFLARGLNVVADPDAVSARVKTSAVRTNLVTALDDWLILETDEAVRDRILAILRHADGASGAAPFRDPAVWKDKAKLESLAAKADVTRMSPGAVVAVAEVMRKQRLDARPLLRYAMSLYPRDFHLAFALGQSVILQDMHDIEAVGAYRAARAIRQDNVVTIVNLGIALGNSGDSRGAIAAFREAIRLDPTHADGHYNLGTALGNSGDSRGSIAAFREAIQLNPKHAGGHYNLGTALGKSGDSRGAIAAFREAIQLNPKHAGGHYNLGVALKASGDVPGAIAAFRESSRLEPNNAGTHHNLASAYGQQKQYPEAITSAREAIRLNPKAAATHALLGYTLRDSGDLAAGRVAFAEAVRLDPKQWAPFTREFFPVAIPAAPSPWVVVGVDRTNPTSLIDYGNAQRARGLNERAAEAYREAIKLDPTNPRTHNLLGLCFHADKNYLAAEAAYREAIRIDPVYAIAHSNLAIVLRLRGQYSESLVEAREALKLNPKSAAAHATIGHILKEEGDLEGAKVEYEEAARLDPKQYGNLPKQLPSHPVAPPPRAVMP